MCTLERERVSWDAGVGQWRVMVRTRKTGESVYLPIPQSLEVALDAVPLPRNGPRDCAFLFWNGHTSPRAVVGTAECTLIAVFKKSLVKNAHAHRYRHTLATKLLSQGVTLDDVADILGNTVEVVRKHDAKWLKARQTHIDRIMNEHFLAGRLRTQSQTSHTKKREP